MSRLLDVLAKARTTLADQSKLRWSDERLLELLDEGQKQMAIEAALLRSKTAVSVQAYTAEFDMPADCYQLTRVEYMGTRVELISHEEMDKLFKDRIWTTQEGSQVEKIVYDRSAVKQYKVYPLQTHGAADISAVQAAPSSSLDAALLDNLFGVVTGSGGAADELLQTYGVVTDILYTWVFDTATGLYVLTANGSFTSIYGLVTSIADDLQTSVANSVYYGLVVGVELYQLTSMYGFVVDASSEFDTIYLNEDGSTLAIPYGITLGVQDMATPLMVYYIKHPETLTLAGELEIDQVHDTALKYYVVAAALLDDQDTQNSAMADKYAMLFAGLLAQAKSAMQKDLTKPGTQYMMPYSTGF